MLKKLKLLKKPLFQKRRWSCDFPPRKMPVALKHRAISRQEKMAFSAPVGLSWASSPPPTECTDGPTYRCTDVRTYGCTDVRTDGHVTITSQPKFLGLIGYHISLAMELRWLALPAGSAINDKYVPPKIKGISFPILQSFEVTFRQSKLKFFITIKPNF